MNVYQVVYIDKTVTASTIFVGANCAEEVLTILKNDEPQAEVQSLNCVGGLLLAAVPV